MSPIEMELAMEKQALPDAERVIIRDGYLSLVSLGWPTEHITMSMCAEFDHGHFDAWVDVLTVVDYQTRRAQEKLRSEWAIESSRTESYE